MIDKDTYKKFDLNIETTNPLNLEDYPTKLANDAVTPPYVGSVKTDMYKSPASSNFVSAAVVFAICIRDIIPSCILAPPEQTIGEELPDGFQTAEFLLEHGFIDKIVEL